MKVNEIFCSVQGEGHHTGKAAVFLRFSGCNMKCSFCDTRHESFTEMTEDEILEAVCCFKPRHIVITGGEPAMQLSASLTDKLHEAGFYIQIETNGSLALPKECKIDWVSCSPKGKPDSIAIGQINELKLLYWGQDISEWEEQDLLSDKKTSGCELRLQPLDSGDEKRNKEILLQTFAYIIDHPQWALSLQTHKLIGVR